MAFFNASALVLLCGHDYIAALFIVLYVGAMCTFFLFAIMILDIKVEQVSEKRFKQSPAVISLAVIWALQCKNLLNISASPMMLNDKCWPLSSNILDHTTQIYSLGAVLYTSYAWYLILASLILLSAMLGSIVLTLNKSSNGKNQQIYQQNLRDFILTVTKHR